MAKKLVCPKCGGRTSPYAKSLWGMCAVCALKSSPHLMDAASWTPPGEEGVLWKPPVTEPPVVYKATDEWQVPNPTTYEVTAYVREWTAKDLAEHDFTRVERDLFKMTVEDVILDFGCRVWEAV